ncbi:MAG TPA: hypothetical protein VKP13_16855 [Nitrospira sp.]|nr:hypothetical protein [Nitrospira sp.]
MNTLIELRKRLPHQRTHFLKFASEFISQAIEFIPNRGMPLGDLSDIASESFGDGAKVAFDLFHLLGVHGTPCLDRSPLKCNADSGNERRNGGFWETSTELLLLLTADS